MGEGGAAPALPAQSGPAFPACSPGVPGQHSAGCRWRPACHQSPGGRAVVGCVLALLARLSASGQGGPQASSSGVPALPAEALALSITSIHLRGGAEVRAAPPTARLGGRVCSGPQIGRLVPQHLPKNDPKSRGKGPLNPSSSARQPLQTQGTHGRRLCSYLWNMYLLSARKK